MKPAVCEFCGEQTIQSSLVRFEVMYKGQKKIVTMCTACYNPDNQKIAVMRAFPEGKWE